MCMLDRRIQILLDRARYQKVQKAARRRGIPVAAVIRDAIDQLPDEDDWERRRAAIEAILRADPIPVPDDPADLRRALDEARARDQE